MSRKTFEDVPGDDTIIYDVVDEDNGYRQCTFRFTADNQQEYFNNIPNMRCKDDDILLNSYPKTGTHWIWEMLQMVLKGDREVSNGNKVHEMIEAIPTDVLENLPSPRIINTHLKIRYLPKDVFKKNLKMILLLRNPKDVAVSLFNHTRGIKFYDYSGKFPNFLQMFMRGEVDYGSYPEFLREWQSFITENPDCPVHVVYYEGLQQDCLGEMRKLCKFLEKDVTDDFLQDVVKSCQIGKMRQVKEDKMTEEMKVSRSTVCNKDFSMFRKGQIGDWRNWFTVAQNEMFEHWWAKETQGLDMFTFKYS